MMPDDLDSKLDERYIIPLPVSVIQESLTPDVIRATGGSLEQFLETALNLWPHMGFNDYGAAHSELSGWVSDCLNLNEEDEATIRLVDDAFVSLMQVTRQYLAPVLEHSLGLHDSAIEDRCPVGGRVESFENDAVIVRVYFGCSG